MFYVLTYVAAIVAVNIGFSIVPLMDLGSLGMWPPMSIAVGAVFVLRDYAQRDVGHHVLYAMAVGIALSYLLADPYVAVASGIAFAASELADWALYTVTKRPFHQRVLLSSLASTPIDSALFLVLIGHFSVIGVVTMTVSKMLAALIVWRLSARGASA
jgi:uncharacterized PurR-regulated membrane protein YhhQ (DUF165 family)